MISGSRKWSYNECKKFIEEHKIRINRDFGKYKSGGTIYRTCKENGWINEFLPKDKLIKYKECKKKYSKCKDLEEFKSKFPNDFKFIENCGWINDLIKETDKSKNLSKDDCEKIVKSCKDKKEFRIKFPNIYQLCCKNNWLNDFSLKNTEKFIWNIKNTLEEINKKGIKYLSELRSELYCAYRNLKKNNQLDKLGLINDIKDFDKEAKVYGIYSYLFSFEEKLYAYIGLSKNFKDRDTNHRNPRNGRNDPILDFCTKHNIKFPKYKKELLKLNVEEAQYWEDYYKNHYYNLGYVILNKGKTGVGIGSIGRPAIKWTYKECQKVAKNYNNCSDFIREQRGCYLKALKSRWLFDYSWMSFKNHNWRESEISDYISKFSTIEEFKNKYKNIYEIISSRKWEYLYDKYLNKENKKKD